MNYGLTDSPILKLDDETLGITDYVSALSNFIMKCQTPITISIQGDWGTGKTSMMNLVKERIEKEKIKTIWFNTWQYSQFRMDDEVAVSLLSSLLDDLGESGKDARKRLFKIGISGIKHAVKAGADIMSGGFAGKAIEQLIAEQWASEDMDPSRQIKKLRADIQQAVETQLKNNSAVRLVIFIDDLDRLMPEKAVEILEIIKLFLDIPNCVFVLAVDYNVVAKGLEKKFGVSMNDLKGKSFFDKIIQLPFNLPISHYKTNKYLEVLLSESSYNKEDLDTYLRLVTSSIGSNPRSMKRLFNLLQLLTMVADAKKILDVDNIAKKEEKHRILFAVLCLQLAYEPMYRLMIKQKDSINQEFFDDFMNSEKLVSEDFYHELRNALNLQDEEMRKKFVEFMTAFYEAIQLDSDTQENAAQLLSLEETENLKRFLSFSSLTSSSGAAESTGESGYSFLAKQFIEKELNPKFQEMMEKVSDKGFIPDSGEDWFNVRFEYVLKTTKLGFQYLVIYNEKEIRISVSDSGISGSKYLTEEWFNLYMKTDYPKMEINKRRYYEYIVLFRHQFKEGFLAEKPDEKIKTFKNVAIKAFDVILPKLITFHEKKPLIINQVTNFAGKIVTELQTKFPHEEGWKVESKIGISTYFVLIHQPNWNDKVHIYIANEAPFYNNLYIGLDCGSEGQEYGEGRKESVYEKCDKELFPQGNKGKSRWSIFFYYLPPDIANTTIGDFIRDDWRFAYDTPEKEAEAISKIVAEAEKFKTIKTEIDELARGAK